MSFDKAFDGSHEDSGHGTPESRGSNGLAAMRAKEADHAAALLQAGGIGIQVQAVDALDFEGDVMLQDRSEAMCYAHGGPLLTAGLTGPLAAWAVHVTRW